MFKTVYPSTIAYLWLTNTTRMAHLEHQTGLIEFRGMTLHTATESYHETRCETVKVSAIWRSKGVTSIVNIIIRSSDSPPTLPHPREASLCVVMSWAGTETLWIWSPLFITGSNEISKNSYLRNKPECFFLWFTLKHCNTVKTIGTVHGRQTKRSSGEVVKVYTGSS